jgi:hypothetical protein
LLKKIFDELFKQLGKAQGDIVSDSGRLLKLTAAIEQIFRNFNSNENLKIVNTIMDSLIEIGTLNQKYFTSLGVRVKEIKKVYSEVDVNMRKKAGIGKDGKMIKDGWMDKLLKDDSVRKAVLSETRKAFTGKAVTLEQYMNKVRDVLVGDERHAGKLSHHYRTYAHDTFSQFDNEYADKIAKRLDLNAAVYEGGVIGTSRDFCKKKSGKVFTRKEIEAFRDDPDLLLTKDERKAGRPKDYIPTRDKGRWNCRHYYNWITEDEAMRMRPSLKNVKQWT